MSNIYDLQMPPDCPLDNIKEYEGIAYRVVITNPPTSEDLLTYLELKKLPKANACKRASISLFQTEEQAKHRMDVSPGLGVFIASVSLTKAHGRVSYPTNYGHIDWWPYAGMRNPSELKVVE